MGIPFRFNRQELAGSLGSLGTLLPISLGMILVNGLHPMGLFFSVGAFFLLSGLFFRIPVPVEPMKVIGAYAVATGLGAAEIMASSLLMAAVLLLVGLTGAVSLLGRYTPRSVIRGVQMSTGLMLIAEGVRFMLGTSAIQRIEGIAEPFLAVRHVGPVPIGPLLGITGAAAALLLLNSRRLPAALALVLGGAILGLVLGAGEGLTQVSAGFHLPAWLPAGLPARADFTFALLVLVLPQLPMSLGNAAIANSDLSREYFGAAASRMTPRAACISMGLANLVGSLVGGMPMCHGSGGLAAMHRFGARTPATNAIIGLFFIGFASVLGEHIIEVLCLIPMAVLGVLLVFAGASLALTVMDLDRRADFFVIALIAGITLAANLAVGFITGILVAHLLERMRIQV